MALSTPSSTSNGDRSGSYAFTVRYVLPCDELLDSILELDGKLCNVSVPSSCVRPLQSVIRRLIIGGRNGSSDVGGREEVK